MGRQVRFKNVNKRYIMGEVVIDALKDISFSVEEGEFCVILGASGAGKTTLLNLLGGMDRVTDGEIFLGDRSVSSMDKRRLSLYRRYDVGFIFQFYNLIPTLTARENVEIAAMLTENHIDADTALDMVGLSERADNFPAQLSGGEQQRVAIARAVAKKPSLLLCDEPTGALDYETGKSVLKLLHRIGREDGRTTFVITHNQAIAPIADRVIRMRSGIIEENQVNRNIVSIDDISW